MALRRVGGETRHLQGENVVKRTCPECSRELEPQEKGRFKVLCWPTHNAVVIAQDYKTMTTDELNRWTAEHRESTRSTQFDRCVMSGQPVD